MAISTKGTVLTVKKSEQRNRSKNQVFPGSGSSTGCNRRNISGR